MLSEFFEMMFFPHEHDVHDSIDDVDDDGSSVDTEDDSLSDNDTIDDADRIIDFAIHESPLALLCDGTSVDHIDSILLHNDPTTDVHTLIMGAVQSGKSRAMFGLALYLAMRHHHHIVVLLRDFTCDYRQFEINFESFLQEAIDSVTGHEIDPQYQEIRDLFPILYAGDIKELQEDDDDNTNVNSRFFDAFQDDRGSVTLCLCNPVQIRRLGGLLDSIDLDRSRMSLFIDEVDELFYSGGALLKPQLAHLHGHFSSVFGISATVFDPLHDDRFIGSRVLVLPPPDDYKGVDSIVFQTIGAIDSTMTGSGRLDQDPDLVQILDAHRTTTIVSNGTTHPMIMLLKNERLIKNQKLLLTDIRHRYGTDYSVVVFNGESATAYIPHYKKETAVLKASHRMGHRVGTHIWVFRHGDLQDILQLLKDHGATERIIIIAHNLIGRGINIVSRDFGWHLTHMFYRPSKGARVPQMIQSMRLCGRYKDNIPLYLYAEEKIIRDIQRGHRLQEELVDRIRDKSVSDPTRTARELLEAEAVHPRKVPSRNLLNRKKKSEFACEIDAEKDTGITMEEFEKGMCITQKPLPPAPTAATTLDEKEFLRLTNDKNGMFKKWADVTNQSAIARFMREGLDPHKEYTKQEITDLCKEYGIQMAHIMGIRKKSQTHAQILVRENMTYRLYPNLVESFEKYF